MSNNRLNVMRPQGRFYFSRRLGSKVKRLSRLSVLRRLRGLFRRLLLVSKPTEKVISRVQPRVMLQKTRFEGLVALSANLWHDWPCRRRLPERLEAFAKLVEREQAHVVLLQELVRTPDFQADEWLADRLGMAYVYSRANGHLQTIGFEEGLGVLSRFPISDASHQPLGSRNVPFVHRLALGAQVETLSGPLWAFSVHLGLLRRRNVEQMRHLREWVGQVSGLAPALIGSDFNCNEGEPQIAEAKEIWLDTFRHLHPTAEATTHALRWPWGRSFRHRRLDYLFMQQGFQDWRVVEARHIEVAVGRQSDHHVVLTRLVANTPSDGNGN